MKGSIVLLVAMMGSAGWSATVTTAADDGPGSLRQAIVSAAAGETITFSIRRTAPGREVLTAERESRRHLPGPTVITLTSGELLIDKDLTIAGPGASRLFIQRRAISGTPEFRIFNVQTGTVTITGLTVSNGRAIEGGGIRNTGTLTLCNCVISGNAVNQDGGGMYNAGIVVMSNCVICNNFLLTNVSGFYGGGGIWNDGNLTAISCVVISNVASGPTYAGWGGGVYNRGVLAFTNSTIRGNSAMRPDGGGDGGGIFVQGTVTVDSSTMAWNSANNGGGTYIDLGRLTLARSTVSWNSAAGGFIDGGGVANEGGLLLVESSTISSNVGGGIFVGVFSAAGLDNSTVTANAGGGIYNDAAGLVVLENSILAGNNDGADLGNSGAVGLHYGPGRTESAGCNLVGSTNGLIIPAPGDQFNVTAERLRLGPLQDNGGPTLTHQLLCGSPAINAGDNSDAPPTDQRGFPRIMGGIIDIGAYESGTQPGEAVNADGCTVFDLCPCCGAWKNHGEFVSCVKRAAAEFVAEGLMSEAERGRLISAAERSDCGKRH